MKTIDLPEAIQVVQGPVGPRFRGPAPELRKLAESLRTLRNAPIGLVCHVGSIELYVTEDPNDPHGVGRISLPREAWNILASKIIEVTAGWEKTPFDFGDCGYLDPRPEPDLGIELLGDPETD
jgi:hypothetical protein